MRWFTWLFSFWLLLSVAVCAQTEQAASKETLDVKALIKDALDNGRGDKLLTEYTYLMRMSEGKIDKQGQVKETSENFEAYVPTLRNRDRTSAVLLKLTEKGVPLPGDKLEKERQKAAERLLKSDADAQKYNSRNAAEFNTSKVIGAYFQVRLSADVDLNIKVLLRTCEFNAPRRELIDGRETIALDFSAPAATDAFEKNLRYLARTAGTVWIDVQERILVRAEGWPRAMAAHTGKPAFLYEQIRLPDGYWLTRLAQLNGATHHAVFGSLDKDVTFEFSDYKRFGAEVKDVKVGKP